ncbi:SLBB domain-containing protein [Idiomarina seosinensis]|nr:SLBB domain-containing protein [Idiomarina seosinensis]
MRNMVNRGIKAVVKGLLITQCIVGVSLAATPNAMAQSMPSQAQIEQLKNLPPAQQRALARQYGIDLDSLTSSSSSSSSDDFQREDTVKPRTVERNQSEGERTGGRSDQQRESEEQLKFFGYDIFAGEPSTFAPIGNAPVPGSYRIGPGDTILIQLYGKESINHQLTVNREGVITVPDLGPLTVTGMSYEELKSFIKDKVSKRMIGMQAAVSMGELRSMQVFVLGEAYQPGAYTVSSLTTISQALIAAGGFSNIGSLRNVQLKRSGETIVTFDVYDLLIDGDGSKDRILQPGDAVFIPPRGGSVKVNGEVLRPAIYELKQGETLEDAIELAGGELPSAYLKAIQLYRVKDSQRVLQTVDATTDEALQLAVKQGDEIRVPRISEVIDNSVKITGAVTRSGSYEWYPGLSISDFVTSVTQDLMPDTDLNYGLLIRDDADTREISVLQFNPGLAIDGDEEHNLTLQPRDEVLFFSRFEREQNRINAGFSKSVSGDVDAETTARFSRSRLLDSVIARLSAQGSVDNQAQYIRVSGEVRYPGEYPLVVNANVKDMIAAAGGLKESAFLARAEVTRTTIENGEAQTEYLPFNLESVLSGNETIDVQARDRLNVFRIPEWSDTVDVEIGGEVRFPGTYAVRRGDTLQDLIKRAGGFTKNAFIEGSVFTREEIKSIERERISSLTERLRQEIASQTLTGDGNNINYEQLTQLLNDLQDTQAVGRLIIDIPSVIAGRSDYDVELMDGDRLMVPSRRNMVSIVGEVQMPSTYRYEEGVELSQYLSRSGGVKKRADDEGIYVIRANGLIETVESHDSWFRNSTLVMQPGDTIVVPLDTSYKDSLDLWVSGTQIVYQMAVALAALNNI